MRIFLFLFLISCAGKNSTEKLPQWYMNPKQSDPNTMYGVGFGYSPKDAKDAALADAASKISVSISSDTKTQDSSTNAGYLNEVRRKTNIKTQITFQNFKISNQFVDKLGVIYNEVSIPKQGIVDEQSAIKQSATQDLTKSETAILAEKNPIRKIAILHTAIDQCHKILDSSRILHYIDGENVDFLMCKKYENMNPYSGMRLFIKGGEDVRDVIVSAAKNSNIYTVQKQEQSNAILEIIKSSAKSQIYNTFSSQIMIDLSLNGDTNNTIICGGASSVSNQNAYRNAIGDCKKFASLPFEDLFADVKSSTSSNNSLSGN